MEIAYAESALEGQEIMGYQDVEYHDFVIFQRRSVVYGRLPILQGGRVVLPWAVDDRALRTADEEFIRQVRAYVEAHLDDPRFGVSELERLMGMSHAQFYRRLERALGYSGNELIRRMRINRAIELMERTDLRVNDIAYETGFRDPAYFSRVFREQLGVTPTAFRRGGNPADKEKTGLHKV